MKKDRRSLVENMQLLAMAAVEDGDRDYVVRRIQRVFSTTFNVPITETEDLDLAYMLQHIFEHNFEQANPQDRSKIAETLLHPGKKEDEDDQRSDEDDIWEAQIKAELEAELEKEKKKDKEKAEKAAKIAKLPDLNLKIEEDF